jgi:hypothetical protein
MANDEKTPKITLYPRGYSNVEHLELRDIYKGKGKRFISSGEKNAKSMDTR